MRLSTRGRYAVMAMVELAAQQGEGPGGRPPGNVPGASVSPGPPPVLCRPVALAEIATAQQLSLAYLEQLFGPLRRGGLVASVRGPGGGYRLARPAAAISVAEIIQAVDEPLHATRCEEGSPGCLAGHRCLTHELWSELGEQIRLFLSHLTLADVVDGRVAGRAVPPRDPAQAAPAGDAALAPVAPAGDAAPSPPP